MPKNSRKYMNEYMKKYRKSPVYKNYHKKWLGSEHGKEVIKKWRNSSAGKKSYEKYRNSPAHKEYMKKYLKKYIKKWRKTPEGEKSTKEASKKWRNSPQGKKSIRQYNNTIGKRNVRRYTNSPKGRLGHRKRHLMGTYGITIAQRNKMVREQHGRCYICKKGETVLKKSGRIQHLCVDHNPKTMKIGKLLCHSCNVLVDDLETRRKPVKYYQRYLKEPSGKIKYRSTLTYGIPIAQRRRMLKEQNNLCYICKKGQTSKYKGKIKSLEGDHNYKTNTVRHMLCNMCHTLITSIENKRAPLKSYINYLKEEMRW